MRTEKLHHSRNGFELEAFTLCCHDLRTLNAQAANLNFIFTLSDSGTTTHKPIKAKSER